MLAYNVGKYLPAAIESVLSQKTDFDFELVVAEDKSTDNSLQIIREYKAKYPDVIELIANDRNLGLSGNYVRALKNCTGQYVAILDGDDCWTDPDKLQKQADFLDANKEYGIVYSDCRIIDNEGKELEWKEMDEYRQHFSSGRVFFKLLEVTAFVPNLTGFFRRDLIADELENEDLWFFEDWWLWMRVAIKAKFHYLDAVTGNYRLHSLNDTGIRKKNKKNWNRYQRKAHAIFYSNLLYFDHVNRESLNKYQNRIIFRRILMLLYRTYLPVRKKVRLIPLFVKYFPGPLFFTRVILKKIRIQEANLLFL